MKLFKQLCMVIAGIIIMHFAVVITMQANIGIGGYDAFGLSLSYITNISVGTIFIFIGIICLVGQILIEKKSFKKREFFQLIFVFGSGFAVDLFLKTGMGSWTFQGYPLKIAVFCGAVVLKSFAIMMIIESDLMKMPLEGLCVILSERSRFSIGTYRVFCDVFFLVSVLLITFICKVDFTIGLGTIITMVIQGPMMDVFKKPIDKIYQKFGIR